ncbi:hypothetical protein OC845_005617 [Tilletia horrida]|nr:hypothetical protein OC845_005617 [Tilletia horrida]
MWIHTVVNSIPPWIEVGKQLVIKMWNPILSRTRPLFTAGHILTHQRPTTQAAPDLFKQVALDHLPQVTLGDVTYTYGNQSEYREHTFMPRSLEATKLYGVNVDAALTILNDQGETLSAGIPSVIEGTGLLSSSEPYSSAFERMLAKNYLSFGTVMTLLTILTAVLACVAGTSRTRLVGPLQIRLTSTAGNIAEYLAESNPSTEAQFGDHKYKLFAPETEAARLDIGYCLMTPNHFGVTIQSEGSSNHK